MRPLLTALLLLVAQPDGNELELPPLVRTMLSDGTWKGTVPTFRLIALSNVADGCAQQAAATSGREAAARACVLRAQRRAQALLPENVTRADGLFLTHFALILGDADAVGGCADPALHTRVARELAARSLADPLAHAASYTSTSLRWPADQSATLAALARYDAAHHGTLLAEPLRRWEAVMETHLDEARGLPWSEATGRGPGATMPRGCAQSFISRYLAEADPVLSHRWWETYRDNFLVRPTPFVGFREWPAGVERGPDEDSGPIILGIGAAASAFGVAAARAQGDALLAAQLEGGQDVVLGMGVGGPAAHTTLAEAIRFSGHWQQRRVFGGTDTDGGQPR